MGQGKEFDAERFVAPSSDWKGRNGNIEDLGILLVWI